MPKLALLFGFAFILWMFGRDMRWRRLSSHALWIPASWLAMGSSRQMSFWLDKFGIWGGSNRLEGSPVNIIFNNGLFLAAILVLYKRRFGWARYASANKAVFSMYAFFLCSAVWSPFPVPTAKRLVQEFGWMLVAPIILTEQDPAAAMRLVFVRVSYILFPLSPILIRYFPGIGRQYSLHGSELLSGVADHKNSLGQLCFVFCLVLIWDLIETRKTNTESLRKPEYFVRVLNLGIGLYLLVVSSSATSWICFLFGLVLLMVSKRLAAIKNARRVFILGVLATLCLLALEQGFQISSRVSEAFGRGEGMSGRSDIWRVTLEQSTNPLLGTGFHVFWDTSAGRAVNKETGTGDLNTAHNGYLETYLNGGLVGLFFLMLFIWFTGLEATDKLILREPMGRMAIVFWPLLMIYNLSESQFMMAGPVWYVMLLTTMGAPWWRERREEMPARVKMRRQGRQQLRQLSGGSAGMVVASSRGEIPSRRHGLWSSASRQGR